jgi:hypothetical protein
LKDNEEIMMFGYWNDSAHAEARRHQIHEEIAEMRLANAVQTESGLPRRIISAAGSALVAVGTRLQEQRNDDAKIPAYMPSIETLSH